jgi:3-oxoacyl-[acyl-carrier-protein] synthase-3
VQSIGQIAGFTPEQVPWESLSKYGNQSSASIPVAICCRLQDAGRDLRLMLCGYGIGLSWASCLGSFPELRIFAVHDFVPPGPPVGRAEHIARWRRKFKGEDNG